MPMVQNNSIAPWIQTFAGHKFDFERMSDNVWDAEEIATVLSRVCRFSGHTKWTYTVAQHSVLVARRFTDCRMQLVALLHDAAESCVGDVSAPLKSYLSDYSPALDDLEVRIWEWISFTHGWEPEIKAVVKREDLAALATEARDLMLPPPSPWVTLPSPWPERIEPWLPEYARDQWLCHYERCLFAR